MRSSEFIKKIKLFTLIAFLLPLITINLCLVTYKILGSYDVYPSFNWDNKNIKVSQEEYDKIILNTETRTFKNCPEFQFDDYLVNTEGQVLKSIKKIETKYKNKVSHRIKKQNNKINERCIKNSYLLYNFIKIDFLDKLLVIASDKGKSGKGFARVKNPYLYGEVSISRTARFFPAILIFKPFIILSAIFLFFYWKNNLNLFKELESNNIMLKSSKTFFYLGIFSCLFLMLHATFLGLNIDSQIFKLFRKVIIILFIVFELFAQIFLTKNLFKFRNKLKEYIKSPILKLKIIFVTFVILITVILLSLLIWGDLSSDFKNIAEWNYFSFLLLYYFLSFLLWKDQKNQKIM
jgi:hypothetical protein